MEAKVKLWKTPVGLAKGVEPKVDPNVTHRGQGAFCRDDFSKVPEWMKKRSRDGENDEDGNLEEVEKDKCKDNDTSDTNEVDTNDNKKDELSSVLGEDDNAMKELVQDTSKESPERASDSSTVLSFCSTSSSEYRSSDNAEASVLITSMNEVKNLQKSVSNDSDKQQFESDSLGGKDCVIADDTNESQNDVERTNKTMSHDNNEDKNVTNKLTTCENRFDRSDCRPSESPKDVHSEETEINCSIDKTKDDTDSRSIISRLDSNYENVNISTDDKVEGALSETKSEDNSSDTEKDSAGGKTTPDNTTYEMMELRIVE